MGRVPVLDGHFESRFDTCAGLGLGHFFDFLNLAHLQGSQQIIHRQATVFHDGLDLRHSLVVGFGEQGLFFFLDGLSLFSKLGQLRCNGWSAHGSSAFINVI